MSEHEAPVRTIAELIGRNLPIYLPDAVYDYLGTTLSEVDKQLFEHISKTRSQTVIPMT